jgi:DNA repair exonuclease SbcCD ATPase subunit
MIQLSAELAEQLRGQLKESEERADDSIQRLAAQMEAFEALRSQNAVTAEALKTANEKYQEACAVLEAKDAKLKSNETALNNDKLNLKEQVSQLQQERGDLALELQSKMELWERREAEQKDREQLLAGRLKKSQQKMKDLMAQLRSKTDLFGQNEAQFRTREQQMNADLSESRTAIQQLKKELQNKSETARQLENALRSREKELSEKIQQSKAEIEEGARELRAKVEAVRAAEIREHELTEKLRKAEQSIEQGLAAIRANEERARSHQIRSHEIEEDLKRQLQSHEEKARELTVELDMMKATIESSTNRAATLEQELVVVKAELADTKRQAIESSESITQLKATNQKLQHMALKAEEYKSSQEETSGDLRRLKALAEQQKQELSRKSQEIVTVQKEYNQILRALKKERQDNAALSSQLQSERKTSAMYSEAQSIVESLHSNFSEPKQSFRSALHELAAVLEPLFTIFSLGPVELTIENLHCQLDFRSVISIEPVEEPVHEIEQLRTELMKLPIDQPLVSHQSAEKKMNEQISELTEIAKMIHGIFDEKERDIKKMTDIIASQHQAVMKLTRSAGSSHPERDMRGV